MKSTLATIRNIGSGPELDLDVSQARQFIRALTGSASTPMTFVTFAESEQSKAKAITLHGPIEEHAATLEMQNKRGALVGVVVNRTDLKGSAIANILAVRALWLDVDKRGHWTRHDVEAIEPQADIIVESSRTAEGACWHIYWLLKEGELEPAQFQTEQRALIQHFNTQGLAQEDRLGANAREDVADKSVCNSNRVLRLPGSWHVKGAPFRTSIAVDRTQHAGSAA